MIIVVSLTTKLGDRFKAEFLAQIITNSASALLVIFLARLLEPNNYGLLFLAISVLSIGRIFSSLGFAKSAARYISEYRQKDIRQIPHIIKRSFAFNLISISIVAIIFLFKSKFIAEIINEPRLAPYLKLGALYIIFGSLTSYIRLISQGFEEIQFAAFIQSIDRVGRLILAITFVIIGYGALGALGGFITGSILSSLIGIYYIYLNHYRNKPKAEKIEEGLARRIIEYNIPLSITGLAGKMDKQVDTILVGFFLNPIAVTFYVVSKQMVEFLQFPSNALGFSIASTFGKQKAANEQQKTANLFEQSFIYTLLFYIPGAAGLYFITQDLIIFFFGNRYIGAVPVLQVLLIYAVLYSITNITDQPLDYLGAAKIRAITKAIASFSNVLLNIFLIPIIGVVGAAIATVITHLFYVAIKFYLISNILPLDTRYLFRHLIYILLIAGTVAISMSLLTSELDGIMSVIVSAPLGIIVWFIFSMVLGIIDHNKILKFLYYI